MDVFVPFYKFYKLCKSDEIKASSPFVFKKSVAFWVIELIKANADSYSGARTLNEPSAACIIAPEIFPVCRITSMSASDLIILR